MDFPLHLRDHWIYLEAPTYYGDTYLNAVETMSNGQSYASLSGGLFSGYFRKDGPRVYQYVSASVGEWLVYDFSRKVGDTIGVYGDVRGSTTIYVYGEGTTSFFGLQRHYMTFAKKFSFSVSMTTLMIVDSLGHADIRQELLPLFLAGASINGHLYGNISKVRPTERLLPSEIELFQNYPNPFNPVTTIQFELPKETEVSVDIYDILGLQVGTVFVGRLAAGDHEFRWEAKALPSGTYLCRLSANGVVRNRLMLLIK